MNPRGNKVLTLHFNHNRTNYEHYEITFVRCGHVKFPVQWAQYVHEVGLNLIVSQIERNSSKPSQHTASLLGKMQVANVHNNNNANNNDNNSNR